MVLPYTVLCICYTTIQIPAVYLYYVQSWPHDTEFSCTVNSVSCVNVGFSGVVILYAQFVIVNGRVYLMLLMRYIFFII